LALRSLTEIEKKRLELLTAASVDVTLIQPTATGLKKSILDATAPVRNFLLGHELHDYSIQGLGAAEHGVVVEAVLLLEDTEIISQASLYRPKTKSGDPRIWFSKLPHYSNADDIVALSTNEGKIYAINLTSVSIETVLKGQHTGPLRTLLDEMRRDSSTVALELLAKLRAIATTGFVPSVMDQRADTAIGRTLEAALGIAINSRPEPDYKGIELKSYRRAARKSRENRKTLFAKVPNWKESKFKSSGEILDAFGYARGDDFKLYCSISTQNTNSQGLTFRMDDKAGHLNEHSSNAEIGAFATWVLADLRKSLAKKHNETFWVGAQAKTIDGCDHFDFRDVIHTRKPILSQFDVLLEQGEITMDHLIKRNVRGRVSEKGPLFKINASALGMLFPPNQTYSLH
jgi:hypothetical protein